MLRINDSGDKAPRKRLRLNPTDRMDLSSGGECHIDENARHMRVTQFHPLPPRPTTVDGPQGTLSKASMEIEFYDDGEDNHCCWCHDGGILVACTTRRCPLVICNTCVDFDGKTTDEFICPSCWNKKVQECWDKEKAQENRGTRGKYPWTIRKSCTVRDFRTGVNTSPLLIIELTLSSLSGLETGNILHEQLKLSYLQAPSDLRYVHIPFDNADLNLDEKRMKELNKIASTNEFLQFKRVLLFVNSHSNDEGLIYHTANGATDFDQFFDWLIDENLENYLFERRSIMVLNCCGSYVKSPDQMASIHRLAARGVVTHIMSFVAEQFHPSLAVSLVTETMYEIFVSRKNFVHALEKHLAGSDVGSHAHINLFDFFGWRTYIWGSGTSRPYGIKPQISCDRCGLILPWHRDFKNANAKDLKSTVTLECRLCHSKGGVTTCPTELQPIHNQMAQKWYFRESIVNAKV